jgi:chitinase
LTFLADVNSHSKVVVCYVDRRSAHRPGNGAFAIENIDPVLCTHIIYAYAGLDNVTHSIKSLDSFLDTEESGGRGDICTTFRHELIHFCKNIFDKCLDCLPIFCRAGQYKKVVSLKQKYPKLKVSISIGGPGEKSWKYSNMAETHENRKLFIDSVLDFIKLLTCVMSSPLKIFLI